MQYCDFPLRVCHRLYADLHADVASAIFRSEHPGEFIDDLNHSDMNSRKIADAVLRAMANEGYLEFR